MENVELSTFGDVKSMDAKQTETLCAQLRERILDAVSKNGGHLASNLGVVELTVALHKVFDLPHDKLIFDVGHQSYVHKMLSDRSEAFSALRNKGGVSGFQLRSESEYDFFGGGHSGTSIAAALGFAEAEKLNGGENYAVAVVGDGSFTNGMVYEALNNASRAGLKLIVIINDNEMSISKNVGGISGYFERLRASVNYHRFKRRVKKGLGALRLIGRPIAFVSKKIKNLVKRIFTQKNLFENLGMDYMGPVDGHNIRKLEAVLTEAKLLGSPVVIHVCTQKGRGYKPAEENPAIYHSVSKFDKENGLILKESSNEREEVLCYSKCFGKNLVWLANSEPNIVAITAAMCEGTGLEKFKKNYPERFFDVGIAEAHAVTFAAGLAAAGKKPVVAIYSSFLQRAYDQIIHDVATQELPVIFAIDRCGFVPGDGVTHQGIFDLAFLLQIPNMTVYTPENYSDVNEMLGKAVASPTPVAIRYPRGGECDYPREVFKDLGNLRYAELGNGQKTVTIVTYGRTTKSAYLAAEKLAGEIKVRIVSLKRVKPIDAETLWKYCEVSDVLFFAEEQVRKGGASEMIISELALLGKQLPKVDIAAVDETFPPHASLDDLYDMFGLSGDKIAERIKELIK